MKYKIKNEWLKNVQKGWSKREQVAYEAEALLMMLKCR